MEEFILLLCRALEERVSDDSVVKAIYIDVIENMHLDDDLLDIMLKESDLFCEAYEESE